MVRRVTEQFEQSLEREMTRQIKSLARTNSDPRVFARRVDYEVVNKARNGQYIREAEARRRMRNWDVEMEEYENCRDKMEGLNPYMELGYDSFAKAYFDYFGHGFNGSPIMDNEYKGWTCPRCGTKYMGPANTMPAHCKCGGVTPMGEYIAAQVYRR